jgi:hypothetical protein
MELLAKPQTASFDGFSLVGLLRSKPDAARAFERRIRYTESEFNPAGVMIGDVSTSGVQAAALVYRIDPRTDRIELRPNLIPQIVKDRQFAAMFQDKMLASIPTQTAGKRDLIAVDLIHSKAERLNSSLELAADPQLEKLWSAMQTRFGIAESTP